MQDRNPPDRRNPSCDARPDHTNGSGASIANRRTEEVIGNPTWSQARDTIHLAAKIEICPGPRRDNATAHTPEVVDDGFRVADRALAEDRLYSSAHTPADRGVPRELFAGTAMLRSIAHGRMSMRDGIWSQLISCAPHKRAYPALRVFHNQRLHPFCLPLTAAPLTPKISTCESRSGGVRCACDRYIYSLC